ncbi:MAG: glucose 1-dehydrogenase [Dehalococcoidia bacterium]|nr:glucose 1-dehydrogenase [Dehalococcoidia bacterium]
MRIDDKVAVVTGAGSGIGEGIALRLAEAGGALVVADIDLDAARATAAKISDQGGEAMPVACNVASTEDARAMIDGALNRFGSVDVLVNNAGIARDAIVPKMTEEMWDAVLAVNLGGVFNCTKFAVTAMKRQCSGRIVNISSRAYLGNYGQANYSATKGAIVGFTRALALEVGPFGIRVNAIAPGYIDTPMTRATVGDSVEQYKLTSPLRTVGSPADIAEAVLFLAASPSDYITGETLSVGGGRSIGQQPF